MNSISQIDHLYAFEDGDTITPGMGVRWVNGETGLALQQYWNPTAGKVVATDFTAHPVILYPQPYSTKQGKIVVPETQGQQWYYGNISDEGSILSSGAVKAKYASLFEITTVQVNGQTFSGLKIKGNLATAADHTDKYIYYQSSYQGKAFICSQLIPIQAAVGDSYKVLISIMGADGSGDNILGNDQDWIKFTASLLRTGQQVTGSMTYKWQRIENGAWKDITSIQKVLEVSSNVLTAYDAGVEGVEQFRCAITYGGETYYGFCEATDIHDPFYIEKGSTHPSGSVNVGEKVTYNPKVYDRATGEVSTGWSFTYTFTDDNGNVLDDITRNNLTYDNIVKHGGISTRIEASR